MVDLALTAAGRLGSSAVPEKERIHQVAKGLEASFLQELFKTMENEAPDGEDEAVLGNSNESKQFQSLLHGALSEQSAGGMGIAAMIEKSLNEQLNRTRTNAAKP